MSIVLNTLQIQNKTKSSKISEISLENPEISFFKVESQEERSYIIPIHADTQSLSMELMMLIAQNLESTSFSLAITDSDNSVSFQHCIVNPPLSTHETDS
ncbi:hypothetical protein BLNAU_11551 [Blattamonas nauphoetae]|uniref:Uncharacterized protein n=1 Tax=Blattamonas nauphoetae TaxID=2049346 RepID=A0ABQ9XND4_9EUKA|nr:hypothetical protein BLNAU_11551 [Blattamonas nauphoetae]